MDKKINEDIKSLIFILDRNKPYIFPVAIVLVSIILFFQFVIPQFGALLKAQKEASAVSLKLETLKANLDVLTNTNEQVLDSQLKILNQALPLNKDFVGIFNSIYLTSQKTGVNLGSFSVKIGDLSALENGDNFPVVRLSIPINSAVTSVNSFIETISKTLPLSEVYLARVSNTSSNVNLSFYYKPLGDSNYSQDARISPISQKGLTIINQLSKFENISSSAAQ